MHYLIYFWFKDKKSNTKDNTIHKSLVQLNHGFNLTCLQYFHKLCDLFVVNLSMRFAFLFANKIFIVTFFSNLLFENFVLMCEGCLSIGL